MEKKLFFILLFSLICPARASDLGYADGYITLASILGCVATGASLIGWYAHQKMLKEDLLRKQILLIETTNRFNALAIQREPNPRALPQLSILPQAARPVEHQPPVYSRPPSYQEIVIQDAFEREHVVDLSGSLITSVGDSRLPSPILAEEEV